MIKLPDTSRVSGRLPVGEFLVEIVGVELKKGKETGNDYLEWQFKVIGQEFNGFRIWDRMSLNPSALWKLKQFKGALKIGDGEIEAEKLIGRQLRVVLGKEVFNGEEQVKLKRFKPVKKRS